MFAGSLNGFLLFKLSIISSYNNIYNLPFDFVLTLGIRHRRNVLHDDLGGLGFTGTGLAGYQDTGVLLALLEDPVGGIGDRKQMGGILEQFPTLVLPNSLRAVDVHLFVGIHRDAHLADVCVDGPNLESGRESNGWSLIS